MYLKASQRAAEKVALQVSGCSSASGRASRGYRLEISNLAIRVAHLFGEIEVHAAAVVGRHVHGAELVFGDHRAAIEAVVAHLGEVLGPEVVMNIMAVVSCRGAELRSR